MTMAQKPRRWLGFGILPRYILRELFVPLFVTMALMIVVAAFSQLVRLANDVSGLGISIWDLIGALPYAVPTFLGMGLPIAYLLAMLMGLGRLSDDREFLAMAASGVAMRSVLRVSLLLGILLFIFAILMTAFVEPFATKRLRAKLVAAASDYFANTLEPKVIHDDLPHVMIYLDGRGKDGEMQNIVIADDRDQERPILLTARRGHIDRDSTAQLIFALQDGELQIGNVKDPVFRRVVFRTLDYQLDTYVFAHRTVGSVQTSAEVSFQDLYRMVHDSSRSQRERQAKAIFLQRRISFPFANVVFVFMVFPLVTRLAHSTRLVAFLASLLGASLYFMLAQATEAIMTQLSVGEFVAAWLPNFIFLVVGMGFTFYRLQHA